MITYLLSKYHPRFLRSLVYMLQASEYHVGEYLKWLWRTANFLKVEQRSQLDKTPKALLLLSIAWLLAVLGIITVIWLLTLGTLTGYLSAVVMLWLLPYLVAHLLIIPLFVIQLIVQKPIAQRRLAKAREVFAAHPGTKIAIAGSFGKTSMREILKTVLTEGKKVAAPPDSYNTPLGIAKFANTLEGDEEVLIFELGEYYPGDVQTLCELIDPDMGIITGVNEAHLEKFKTIEVTQATIFELSDYLGDKPLYVNAESSYAKEKAKLEHRLYSEAGIGEAVATNKRTDLRGLMFAYTTQKAVYQLSSELLGLHHVGPICTAVTIAEELGLKESEIIAGVANTTAFTHRLERHVDQAGVVMLDDSYNGNPDGVTAVIDFLASLRDCRRFYVTPGLVEMGSATEAVHTNIGHQLAAAGIEKVVLIENSVTPFIEKGLQEAEFTGEVLWYDDAVKAFAALPNLTVSGDVVLIQNDWPDQYV